MEDDRPVAAMTNDADSKQRLLDTLEHLLEIETSDIDLALSEATDRVARALGAHKVDAFLYDPTHDTLVALGSSHQPLSALQRRLGLDVLPISNGGRAVAVYQTGRTFVSGNLETDPDELRGIKEGLGVRSAIGVPLVVSRARRGVLLIASQNGDAFSGDDVRFTESVARWVGLVAHRAELMRAVARDATENGRRAVAEEMVALAAHELRNALSPAELRLGALRRRTERGGPVELRELELVHRAIGRVTALVSQMLEAARLDRGFFEVEVEPTDVVQLASEVAAALSSSERPIMVRAPEPVTAYADAARLRQCLENVIGNALKHSPNVSQVTVLVNHEVHRSGIWARIDVIEQGPGVSSEHAFDRFVTGARRGDGMGLGLYLARRIAVLHGGDLRVESDPGRGARFVLTVPASEEALRARDAETVRSLRPNLEADN